jgi:Carboxypeptidase regulatory-like domain
MEFARRRTGGDARAVALAVVLAIAVSAGCHRRPKGPGAALPPSPAAELTLRGRVVDTGDHAVPGARILVFSGAQDAGAITSSLLRETFADADGRFSFARLHAGSYGLLVEATGLASTAPPPAKLPGPDVLIRLAGQGRTLSGQVLAGGAPAKGARVVLGGEGVVPTRETLSGADGQFVFHGLGAGTYTLRATRGALASPPMGGVPTDAAAAPPHAGKATTPARLELGPGVSVGGRVVDDRGSALPGAEVRAETTADDPLPATTHSGPGGAFQLGPLTPGRYRLIARAAGYLARGPVQVVLATGVSAPAQRLELLRGASLQGRVVNAHGAPLAGAQIRCLAAGVDDLTVLYEPLPLAAEAAALGSGAGRALGSTRTARSDATGRFQLEDLLPGRVHLEVTRAPSVPLSTEESALAPGQHRDVGVLMLRDGLVIHGRVLDDAGGPLPGARASVTPQTGVFAETDPGGAFVLSLPPGRYALTVSAPGFTTRGLPLQLAENAAVAPPLEIRMTRADGVIQGIAKDSGGRPLVRARVRAWTPDPARPADAPRPLPSSAPQGAGVTDAGGHFSITGVPRQALLLEIDHPNYPPTFVSATPGTLAVLAVPIPGGIDGEVRERGTGAAVSRFRVEATGPAGQMATAAAGGKNGAGAFRLPRLGPGRWSLMATAPGYHPGSREVDVPPSASSPTAGEMSVRNLRIELDPAR